MLELLTKFLFTSQFIAHGHCYLWKPGLVWLHIVSDSLIALAYYSIPIMLIYFVRNRRDLPYSGIFLMFGTFIVACGTTHIMEIWTLWHPTYWLSGLLKAITALASVCTATELVSLIPKALALPSPAQLEIANLKLSAEIIARSRIESQLLESQQMLLLVMDNIPQSIYWKDKNFVYLGCNRHFARAAGVESPEGIVGKTDSDLPWTQSEADHYRKCDLRVMETNQPEYHIIETSLEADGKQHWKSTNKIPLHDTKGNVVGILGTAYDITERQHAEAALKESEAKYRTLIETTDTGFVIVAPDGQVIDANSEYVRLCGYKTLEEIQGCSVLSWTASHDLVRNAAAVERCATDGSFRGLEIDYVHPDGSLMPVEINATLVNSQQGQRIMGLCRDITERKQMHSALQKEQQFLKAVLDNINVGIAACDSQGILTLFNQATINFHNLPQDSLAAEQWSEHYDLYLPDGKTLMHKQQIPLFRALRGEEVRDVEMMIIPKQGPARTVVASGQRLVASDGATNGAVVAMHDITDLKQAQEELHESKLFAESIAEYSTSIIYVFNLDTMTNVYVNRDAAQFLGYNLEQIQAMGKNFLPTIVHPDDLPYTMSRLEQFKDVLDGEVIEFEQQIKHVSGEWRWLWNREVVFKRKPDGTPYQIMGTAQDITERKQAEAHSQTLNAELEKRVNQRTAALRHALEKLEAEMKERSSAESALLQSEERMRLAVESTGLGTWDYNPITGALQWCDRCKAVFGLPPEASVNYEVFLSCLHPEDRERTDFIVQRALDPNERGGYNIEYRTLWADGTVRWAAAMGKVFLNQKKQPYRFTGTVLDITERKLAEEQLKASLEEKVVLLKEIHHRVKNNLQIISSLLSLQSNYVDELQTLEILQSGQNRVASMALIHEQLYQSENFASIDVGEYIQNLVINLLASYDKCGCEVYYQLNIADIKLELDLAIPCGLIVNELVSNSLKHAFVACKSGRVNIEFYLNSDHYFTLIVRDNGIGIPHDLDWHTTDSLGLKLVKALTSQLRGMLELNRNTGTEFKLTFPEKNLE